jgi:hypothetical protein
MKAGFEFAEVNTFLGQLQSFDLVIFNQLLKKGLPKPLISIFSVKRSPATYVKLNIAKRPKPFQQSG